METLTLEQSFLEELLQIKAPKIFVDLDSRYINKTFDPQFWNRTIEFYPAQLGAYRVEQETAQQIQISKELKTIITQAEPPKMSPVPEIPQKVGKIRRFLRKMRKN